MRAVLRYRRIPFQWVPRGSKWDDLPDVPIPIIPAIAFPDAVGNYPGPAMVDSSPQIDRLETMFAERSLTSPDHVVQFLDRLIEDFADEWMNKAMYHYRWHHKYDAAIDKAGSLLPLGRNLSIDEGEFKRTKSLITQRQMGRTAMVGSTDENRPIIESSYRRTLELHSAHLEHQMFWFGDRPGRGDFGMFGQLSQLVRWEPDSAAEALKIAPRVCVWVDYADDLSWLPVENKDGFVDRDRIAPTTLALLPEIGVTYAPFLLANEAAIGHNADTVEMTTLGGSYRQAPFKYQVKCLARLREAYTLLTASDRSDLDRLLDSTGCERLFTW